MNKEHSRKLRIALVALHFAEYTTHLALALASKVDVLLILYRNNADDQLGKGWVNRLADSNLKLLVLERPKSVLSILQNAWLLMRAIRQFEPEIIHYQEVPRDELILGLPFVRAKPIVLTVHDPKPHSGVDTRRLRFSRFRLYGLILRSFSDVAITHGCRLADELVEVSPRFKGRVCSVPHGPLGTLNITDHASPLPKEFRLLFFGRIHEYKGLRYFVDSVIALRDRGYPVKGVVGGRGDDLDLHRQRMVEANCFEILDRYISPEEIPPLFIDSYAVILPYIDGTQSGVAAMALGFARPVVASSVGSIPEFVRNGKNGLLVPPADVVALTHAIETLLTERPLWESMVAGASNLRDGEFSWDIIGNKTFNIYQCLLKT